jgi:hypothetical protein
MAMIALIVPYSGLAYGVGEATRRKPIQPRSVRWSLPVKDNETVNIPVWVGVGAIAIGGLLFMVPKTLAPGGSYNHPSN